MSIAVDLHIHSCLSPCGDELMTPNNIVNMAKLKGLDVISVCDHNTAFNLPAINSVAERVGIAVLNGIELTTKEEVHLLSYFKCVNDAIDFGEFIYEHLPNMKNRPEYFGEQLKLNSDDDLIGIEEKLLISALDLSLDELVVLIDQYGGLAVPAHINRGANGLLQSLGFLPPNLKFAALELSKLLPAPIDTGNYKLLFSSDAHNLSDIAEREHFLSINSSTSKAVFEYLVECKKRVYNASV